VPAVLGADLAANWSVSTSAVAAAEPRVEPAFRSGPFGAWEAAVVDSAVVESKCLGRPDITHRRAKGLARCTSTIECGCWAKDCEIGR
jgi:hypothetical protein